MALGEADADLPGGLAAAVHALAGGDLQRQPLSAAQDVDHAGAATLAERGDLRRHLVGTFDTLAVHGHDQVARHQHALGSRVGQNLVHQRRLQPELPAQPGQLGHAAFIEAGRQLRQRQGAGPHLVQAVEDLDLGIVTIHRGGGQRHAGLAGGGHAAAIDLDHTVAGLQAGGLGHAGGAADGGRIILFPDHEHRPQQGDAQDQVGGRTGGDHRDALPHGLVVEGLAALGRVHLDLALVQHLHVAAQRNGGDREFSAGAVAARPQRLAEPDREAQHLDPATAGHPVVTELVECHQQAKADDHPPDGSDEITHGDQHCKGAYGAFRRGRWRLG
ncbi:hypothetical protein D3C71_1241340 [compost metagenome]